MFKKRLVSAPLLVMPQFTLEFILDTDANGDFSSRCHHPWYLERCQNYTTLQLEATLQATVETAQAEYKSILKGRLQHAYQLVRRHTRQQQGHQKLNYDTLIRSNLVLLHYPQVPRGRSSKLHRPWQSPFRVVSILEPVTYHIVNCARAKTQLVVHFNQLKPLGLQQKY
ncbi:hypothetical protein EMCRGX_G029320 [Ephydatia muelleri]